MYTRRAQLSTLNSLRPLLKVRRFRTFDCPYSTNSFCSIRNLSTATKRSDLYDAFDGNVSEYHLDSSNFNRNDRFHGTNPGGAVQNQNPNRVYGQNLNAEIGNFTTQRSDSYNTSNGIRGAGNQSDYNYGYQNNQFYVKNLGGVDHNQNPSYFHGQNANLDGYNGGGVMGVSQQNHGGTWQQNTRGQFRARKMENFLNNFGGNHHAGNTRVPQPSLHNAVINKLNGDGIYYSNQGNYQGNRSESWGEKSVDYQAPSNMESNEASDDVSQGSQPKKNIEDLDELSNEGKLKEAVEHLEMLIQYGLEVDLPRFITLMKSCGDNEALEEAKSVHMHLLNSTPNIDVCIFNKILDMYSKCGSMADAFAVFDQMPKRNLTSWDIMISGLSRNGLGEDSIELFEEFKRSGLKPDNQMFVGVFSACGVLCDTIEGMLHFESMVKDYGIIPSMDHYVSIVDMFGNAGCLDEALEFIEQMPIEPNVDIWETLMKFCRIHGNVELGDRCADFVQLLDSSRLNNQSKEGLIPISTSGIEKEQAKKKLSGQNLLDYRSRVYEHRAGDRSHPNHENIYTLLRGLRQQMKEVGYRPETRYVLHDVDQESKEEALMAHSERLAAAQAFMTSPPRSLLRIIKNLRVCGDCHEAFKIISKIVGRQIVARDCKRFHHFENGSCSCNDYW